MAHAVTGRDGDRAVPGREPAATARWWRRTVEGPGLRVDVRRARRRRRPTSTRSRKAVTDADGGRRRPVPELLRLPRGRRRRRPRSRTPRAPCSSSCADPVNLGAARAARRARRRHRGGRGAGARRADELRRARTWASSRPSRSWCGACPGAWSAPPSTWTASAASCSRCRRASSTSAARRPRRTSAPTWRCARSWRRSTCRSWASAGCARWASSRRPRRTTPRERSPRIPGVRAPLRRAVLQGVRARSCPRRRSAWSSASLKDRHPRRACRSRRFDRQYKDCLLVAVTEKRTREEIDAYAAALAAAVA